MGNKQEGSDVCMPAELLSYCHHGDMEGHSCDWRVGVEGCRLPGKAGRRDEEGVSLFKSGDQLGCKITNWTAGEQTSASPGICLAKHHGINPGGNRGLRKLSNIHGSITPSSGVMHPKKEGISKKHQEACVNEQGAPEQAQT